jgi:uncharacterized membrane protein
MIMCFRGYFGHFGVSHFWGSIVLVILVIFILLCVFWSF